MKGKRGMKERVCIVKQNVRVAGREDLDVAVVRGKPLVRGEDVGKNGDVRGVCFLKVDDIEGGE
jgi:hypothetical protein